MRTKKNVFTVSLLLLCTTLTAQQRVSLLYTFVNDKTAAVATTPVTQLFQRSQTVHNGVENVLAKKQLLQLNKTVSVGLLDKKPARLSLFVPSDNNGYTLQLAEEDISMEGLWLYECSGTNTATKKSILNAVHYRGYVQGFPESIAAVSVFENGEVMIMFSNREGNFNLGKIKNSDEYVFYNSTDLQARLPFECHTSKLPVIVNSASQRPATEPFLPPVCKKVRFMWEADYKLYINNFSGNFTNTANYIAGLFNQFAVMYANEGIVAELNSSFIWTTPDPYNTTTSALGLSSLKSRYNNLGDNFNADLLMLLDGAPTNNGGLAYILDFDQCNRAYAYGYANVYATYSTVPTYSWDVEVMTHEAGHLLGAYHTQWCGWNTGAGGSCGAIDNCYDVEASAACNTCSAVTNTVPSAPGGFMGTVMSYCYLRNGIGVNLSYGFGQLPQARIRSCVNAAACFLPGNRWTGAVSTAWENTANWSCGAIPDINTDVVISSGLTNYPVINSTAVCRKLQTKTNTSVTVKTGFSLKIAGTGN